MALSVQLPGSGPRALRSWQLKPMAVRLEIARWAGVRADLQASNGEVTLSRDPLLDPALRGSQFNFSARSSEQVAVPSTRSLCALQGMRRPMVNSFLTMGISFRKEALAQGLASCGCYGPSSLRHSDARSLVLGAQGKARLNEHVHNGLEDDLARGDNGDHGAGLPGPEQPVQSNERRLL